MRRRNMQRSSERDNEASQDTVQLWAAEQQQKDGGQPQSSEPEPFGQPEDDQSAAPFTGDAAIHADRKDARPIKGCRYCGREIRRGIVFHEKACAKHQGKPYSKR